MINQDSVPAVPTSAQALVQRADTLSGAVADWSGVVANREEFAQVAENLRRVKAEQKALEAERVSATGPMNQALKRINDWFREPAARLVQAEGVLKRGLAVFERTEIERIAAEQRAAQRRAQEEQEELQRRAQKAAERGKADKAAELQQRAQTVATAPVIAQTIAPKAAQVSFSQVWRFEVTDPAAVPREYLLIDESKIGQYVRAMKADAKIPGVRIYSESSVRSGAAR